MELVGQGRCFLALCIPFHSTFFFLFLCFVSVSGSVLAWMVGFWRADMYMCVYVCMYGCMDGCIRGDGMIQMVGEGEEGEIGCGEWGMDGILLWMVGEGGGVFFCPRSAMDGGKGDRR